MDTVAVDEPEADAPSESMVVAVHVTESLSCVPRLLRSSVSPVPTGDPLSDQLYEVVSGSLSVSLTAATQVSCAVVETLLPGKMVTLFMTGAELTMVMLDKPGIPSDMPSLGVTVHVHS